MVDVPEIPETHAAAATRMGRAPLPPAIREVAHVLHGAGHDVVLVGGAVRDFLLGRDHGDWDLATSATPDEVVGLFRRTIPTGIEHGTVTVLFGRGDERVTTEITTFRGEGDYVDGRRPSEVRFHRALELDLARRDFTINAMAWNPLTGVFTDVFGGLEDLHRGVVRAVGEATERFSEDGLRAMRAVRFCAALGYSLDLETEAAIGGALDTLDQVSRERVQVELIKLLRSPRPSLGLRPMVTTSMWGRVLADYESAAVEAGIIAVDALPADPILRLSRLLWPLRQDRPAIEAVLDTRLRPSRDERSRVLSLCRAANGALAELQEPAAIRRAVAALGREHLADALLVVDVGPEQAAVIERACEGAALAMGELDVRGRDLIQAGLLKPGPVMGRLLRRLFERVLEEPSRNQRALLLAEAERMIGEES